MFNAERSRRRRVKAKALRDAAPPPDVQANGSAPEGRRCAARRKVGRLSSDALPSRRALTVVHTPEQHNQLKPDGWEMAPLAVHRQRPVTHHGFLGADNPFVWSLVEGSLLQRWME
jgi:hypothetical protein